MAKKNANVVVENKVIVTPQEAPETSGGTVSTQTTESTETEETEEPERPFTDADLANIGDEKKRSAIKDGHILATWSTVVVTAKVSPTGKAGSKPYVRLEAQNANGLAALFEGFINAAVPEDKLPDGISVEEKKKKTTKGACDYANYGLDLERRAQIRQQLLSELEGPEKTVRKAVASFLAMEYEPAEVKTMIMNSPKYRDVDGLEKIVDTAIAALNS